MGIKMKHFRQTPGHCGPAVLKIVLDSYGKEYSEKQLDQLSEWTPDGVEHQELIKAVAQVGMHSFTKERAIFKDLEYFNQMDLPVILGWWSDDDDHYSVMINIDEEKIYLLDPQIDFDEKTYGQTIMVRSEFDQLWYDLENRRQRRANHWLMVISKEPKKFDVEGGEYH
jgi:ABC-type bacteriocin/lantibiotic exporter with double-glycine peptidase domain